MLDFIVRVLSVSDDYAYLECSIGTFYYGYEKTWCEKHGFTEYCQDCEETEWVFEAKISGKVYYYKKSDINPSSHQDYPELILLLGITKLFDDGILSIHDKLGDSNEQKAEV